MVVPSSIASKKKMVQEKSGNGAITEGHGHGSALPPSFEVQVGTPSHHLHTHTDPTACHRLAYISVFPLIGIASHRAIYQAEVARYAMCYAKIE